MSSTTDPPPPPFGTYQYEIYLRGQAGEPPDFPVSWTDLEEQAAAALDAGPRDYVWGSCGTEGTARENEAAFRRWRIVPRMLRDVSVRNMRTTVLGTDMPAPVLMAPIGVQSIVHADGELATARAAASLGVPMVASTASSWTLEEIAAAGGADAPRWFQLYWPRGDDLAASLVQRAERAGYRAVEVTLDASQLGWRPRDLQDAYLPFLQSIGVANYLADPVFRSTLAVPPEEDPQAAMAELAGAFSNLSLTWDDLASLREMTSLPILLKGVLHADDARRAKEHGVDGIVVSNHGGRQVDGAIAALDALPGVVDAAGDLAILFDSGVRSGADVMKALALGADAVQLGRPYLWGLARDGEAGVRQVLRNLLAELDLNLALSGYTHPGQLAPDALVRSAG